MVYFYMKICIYVVYKCVFFVIYVLWVSDEYILFGIGIKVYVVLFVKILVMVVVIWEKS